MKNIAIILAGGLGSRFNNGTPKQFLYLQNRRIIDYSINTFYNHADVDDIVIVCNNSWVEIMRKEYPDCNIIVGGKTRQESSLIGLRACPKTTQIVILHDAARPFVSSGSISKSIQLLENYEAINLSVSTKDTVVYVDNNIISSIPKRENIYLSQTPQSFKYKTILNAHKKTEQIDSTDDIQLVKNMNIDCYNLKGDINNIKITYKSDLDIAKLIIKNREKL